MYSRTNKGPVNFDGSLKKDFRRIEFITGDFLLQVNLMSNVRRTNR